VGWRKTHGKIYVHTSKFTFSLSAAEKLTGKLCTHREFRFSLSDVEKLMGKFTYTQGNSNFLCWLWKNSHENSWTYSSTCIVCLSSPRKKNILSFFFNPGLKLLCCITPSYELQIRWFFFSYFFLKSCSFIYYYLFVWLFLLFWREHIRCKPISPCKPCKLQYGPPDQHLGGAGEVGGDISKSMITQSKCGQRFANPPSTSSLGCWSGCSDWSLHDLHGEVGLHLICCLFTYSLFSSSQVENRKICCSIIISGVTSYFLI